VPTGPEAGHCNDGVDNDCNHLIDCADPACQPAVCFGGSDAGHSCEAAADQTACVNGGGVCQCPSIQKDPTSVTFNGRAPGLDRFRSHGRVLTIGGAYSIQTSSVSWLLSNSKGEIFRATLPAGALTANAAGTTFKYKNRLASTAGGISQVKLQNVHGSLKYTVEAFGDLSRATDPNMSVQFYVANQPTPAIHTQTWQKTSNGWTCHSE
jgi:hypothetical protein